MNRSADEPLIIAVDPGTTNFKAAILKSLQILTGNGRSRLEPVGIPIVLEDFPSSHLFSLNTISTALVYNDDAKLWKWGHEAADFQKDDSFDPDYLVSVWKPALCKNSSQSFRDLETKAQFLGKVPQDFAEDFFRALGRYLLHDENSCLLNNFGGNIDRFKYVDCVIAVPPGWSRDEHLVFTRAAARGLQEIPNLRVFAASETECVLRAWMVREGESLMRSTGKHKDTAIVLDMGGGTACVSAFCWLNKKWAHLESHSLAVGSELSTELFARDFKSRLERSAAPNLPKMSILLSEARAKFESRKYKVGEKSEGECWRCPVRDLTVDSENRFEKGFMLFTKKEVWSYFEPSQDIFIAKIAEVIARVTRAHKKPKFCVLAGAYGTNRLFRYKLKQKHNDFDIQIYSPQGRGELVVTGACYARIQGDFSQLAGSRYSAALPIWLEYEGAVKEKNPNAHTFQVGEDSTIWCRALEWIIKKDGHLNRRNEVIADNRKRYVVSDDDLKLEECVYTSEEHPGREKYTVLNYGVDTCGWEMNDLDLRTRYSMQLTRNDFGLDLNSLPMVESKGAEVTLANSVLKQDVTGRYFEYKYFLHLSQTDCRLSMQVSSKRGKSPRRDLQQTVVTFDMGSSELERQYRFVEKSRRIEFLAGHPEPSVPPADNPALNPFVLPLETDQPENREFEYSSMFEDPLNPAKGEGISRSQPEPQKLANVFTHQISSSRDVVSADSSNSPLARRPKRSHLPSGHYAMSASAWDRTPRAASPTLTDQSCFSDNLEQSDYDERPRPSKKRPRNYTAVQSLKVPVVDSGKASASGANQRNKSSKFIRHGLT